ncbi:MAG TPA: hypothetical protein VLB02_03115, partial [Candidatus Paceibacterota bacterium]|nr:hypothetical protein [Candidatus Paceibacterota bacterium]
MQTANIHRTRIQIVMVLVILLGALFSVRLFMLQVVQAGKFTERAERQYVTPSSSVFDRGTIYFTKRDGTTVAAATVASGFKLAIAPAQITDSEAVYSALRQYIELDRQDFFSRAAKKNDPYEEIANRISKANADAITALELPGVSIFKEKWRFYPGGSLAAKTLGFVSYKQDTLLGRYGLERSYNEVLTRNPDSFYVNFFAEIFANLQSTIFKNKQTIGDVVTTIEPSVQSMLEAAVERVESQWQSDGVGGIVMDPHTGDILALAHVPSFDLNEYGKVSDVSRY